MTSPALQTALEALRAATVLVAKDRITTQRERDLKRGEKKHAHKDKVWVEVTSQPKKGRSGKFIGHATFYWKGDHTKKKHTQVISTGGNPAKLAVRGMKLFVKPKGKEGYYWGEGHKEHPAKQEGEAHQHKDSGTEAPKEGKSGEALDPHRDDNQDGVADAARVGVPANEIPPPPPTPRLPNLSDAEREIEARFVADYEKDPEALGERYREKVMGMATSKNEPPTFVTDDVKMFSSDYDPPGASPEEIGAARARRNVLVHQVANAVAKRAFLKHLDELSALPEGDSKRTILVTSGGCGSGKGFSIKSGPGSVKSMKESVGAIWDAAGEQNATENPWILAECKKRGLKATFLFVDADPDRQWANPDLGVVSRAAKPPPKGEGRMVDARLFADSYALGAKNFLAFQDTVKDDPDAKFVFLDTWDNGEPDENGKRWPIIKEAATISDRSLALDGEDLYDRALKVIEKSAPTEAIRDGATIGQRIWGPPSKRDKPTTSARFIMATTKPEKDDESLKELKDTLKDNYEKNVRDLDKFYEKAWKDSREFVGDLEFDEDGRLKPPKTQEREEDGDTTEASARMDAVVEILGSVDLESTLRLALEEAANAVSAVARRRRHRLIRMADDKEQVMLHPSRPPHDVENVIHRLNSLPPSVQRSKDLADKEN